MTIVLDIFHVDILTCLEKNRSERGADEMVQLKALLKGTGLTRDLFDRPAGFLQKVGLIRIEPHDFHKASPTSVRLAITEAGSNRLSAVPRRRGDSLPRTWRVLGECYGGPFVTDGESLYTGSKRVPGADLDSFEVLNQLWACDKNVVYGVGSRLKADRKTFRVLNAIFAKDKDRVYYIEGPAPYIDASSFEVLDEGMYSTPGYLNEIQYHGYGRDKSSVYFQDMMSGKPRLVRSADRRTFHHVRFSYAVDATYVYHEEKRLPRADPQSFEVLSPLFSRDSERVYYGTRLISDADADTFVVLPRIRGQMDMMLYAKDKHHVYCRDRRLDDADVRTFQKTGESSATDGRNCWDDDELVETPPRKSRRPRR